MGFKGFNQFMTYFQRIITVIIFGLLPCTGGVCLAQDGIIAAVKTALEKNPAVLAARDKVEASSRELSAEKYQRLPTLSFETEMEGRRDSEGLLRLLQPLWVGGRIDRAVAAATVELAIARVNLLKAQRGVMEDTAVAYATLLGLKRQIRTAQENIGEHQRLLDLISRRRKGNIASGADVMLARARVAHAGLLREELTGNQKQAMADLTALTLGPVETLVMVPENLLILPAAASMADEMVKASPAVAAADLDVKLARIEKALNKAELAPKVYGRLDQELYDRAGLSDQDLDTRLGLVVEASLTGLGLSRYERVKAAQIRIHRAKQILAFEDNEVRRSTRSLLAEGETIRHMASLHRDWVQSAGATLASYHRQYEAGRKNWLDLLNIQQEYATARLALESARSSLLLNALRLAARTGRLDKAAGL